MSLGDITNLLRRFKERSSEKEARMLVLGYLSEKAKIAGTQEYVAIHRDVAKWLVDYLKAE